MPLRRDIFLKDVIQNSSLNGGNSIPYKTRWASWQIFMIRRKEIGKISIQEKNMTCE